MQVQARTFSPGERLYLRLAALTICLLVLLIIFGVLVRVNGAKGGCNYSYPLCNGVLIPAFHNHLVWMDWGHRLVTLLVGIGMIGTVWSGWRSIHQDASVSQPLYLGAGIFVVQNVLGAVTMLAGNLPALSLLHLGLATVMLSCLVASMTALVYAPRWTVVKTSTLPNTVHAVTLMTFLVLMTGGVVVVSGASTACQSYPLCANFADERQVISMVHRGCVLLLGVLLISLLLRIQAEEPANTGLRYGALILFTLYGVQFGIGALYILTQFDRAISALHVIFASLTWTAAVGLSMITLKQQEFQEIQ